MPKPTFSDYLKLLRQWFKAYQKADPEPKRRGPKYTYSQACLSPACRQTGRQTGRVSDLSDARQVGSGGIESANKFISHVRLKRSGAW